MSNEIVNERLLVRHLAGELAPEDAADLERRLAQDPRLAARYERLRTSWEALELEAAPSVPEDFRDEVMAAARRLSGDELSWSGAPAWARLGATAALVLGLAAGMGFGHFTAAGSPKAAGALGAAEIDAYLWAEFEAQPVSLSEAYWLELEEGGDDLLGGESP